MSNLETIETFNYSNSRTNCKINVKFILIVIIPIITCVIISHTSFVDTFVYCILGAAETVIIKFDRMGIGKSRLPTDKHVVIVGAGYAGSTLGVDLLSRAANVTIIDTREVFHHNIATARALVQPAITRNVFIDYAKTFGKQFVHGRVASLDPLRNSLTLTSGTSLTYDALVIATGSSGQFPSNLQDERTLSEGLEKYKELYEKVKASQTIAVIGGGGAGVELAAELRSKFKDKQVTLFHSRTTLVSQQSSPEFQTSLKNILNRLEVNLVLGERVSNLEELPHQGGPATVNTQNGTSLEVDLVLKCTGMKVNTEPFKASLGDAINEQGQLKVNDYFQVEGHKNIFAIGDCCNTKDFKFARSAQQHSKIMAANLANMFYGKPLQPYNPGETSFYNIALALGPDNGLAMKKNGQLKSEASVVKQKSRDLFISRLWKTMGQTPPS